MSQTWIMGKMLSELMERHGVALEAPPPLPLADHDDDPLVLEGYASTVGGIDAERCAFAPYAFGDLYGPSPPLLFEHDQKRSAGHIEELCYDAEGQLMARAYVTDSEARRRSGFSVGCRVTEFEIRDAGSASGFHSYITEARLTDLSLVQRPVCPGAKVLRRSKPSPASRFIAGKLEQYDLIIKHVLCLVQYTELLQKMVNQWEARA